MTVAARFAQKIKKDHSRRRFRIASICALAGLQLAANTAQSAIVGTATAIGTYRGGAVQSLPTETQVATAPAQPAIAIRPAAEFADTDAIAGPSPGDAIAFTIQLENTGNVGIDESALTVQLARDGEAIESVQAPELVSLDSGRVGVLDVGESWRFQVMHILLRDDIRYRGALNATLAFSGRGGGLSVSRRDAVSADIPPLQGIEPHLLSLANRAEPLEAAAGGLVEITLTIANRSDMAMSAAPSVLLSGGLDYEPGTGRIADGTIEPVVDGEILQFRVVDVPGGQVVQLRFSALVAAEAVQGVLDATAVIVDPATDIPLLEASRASVRIGAADQSACAGMTVRVVNDENRDGEADDGETGIPGVRIGTGDDLPLTTGPDGVFTTPCAGLARLGEVDIGLALDAATLPEGYFTTSPTAARLRIEEGAMAEATFTAARARVLRVDLNAAAFRRGTSTIDRAMDASLTDLVSALGREPSVLRLTYFSHKEQDGLPEQRVAEVRRAILDRWAASGAGYDLQVETRIVESEN